MRYYKSHKFISRAIIKCKRIDSHMVAAYATNIEAKLLSDLFGCKPRPSYWRNIDAKFTNVISDWYYWTIQPQKLTKICQEYGIKHPEFYVE